MFSTAIRVILYLLFTSSLLAYCIWSWLFQTGFYATLIRLQNEYLDIYFPDLTQAFLLILCFILPLALLFKKPKATEVSAQPPEGGNGVLFLLAVVALGIAGFALKTSFDLEENPQPRVIDLSQPPEEWLWFQKVQFDGILLPEFSVIIEESNKAQKKKETIYTPIIANGDDKLMFVLRSKDEYLQNRPTTIDSFVSLSPVSVVVRDAFKAQGIPIADKVYIVGRDVLGPRENLWIVTALFGLFGFFFLIASIIGTIKQRASQKN